MLPKSIDFSMQVDAPDTWLKGDAGELQQAIVNLVLNARDAMPDGGTLQLRASTSHRRGEPLLIVEVSDTGVGMDAATRERIFDPFFTTKPLGKGTGLGLAMVYRSVEGMGGEISVVSAPGEGSTFRMVFRDLPLPPHSESSEPAISPPPLALPPIGRRVRVLVVEDDDTIRSMFVQALEAAGCDVTCAPDGEAALALDLNTEPLDILVTDVVMPGISGVELAEQLVASRPGLRVLFCTGYTDQQIDIDGHAGRALLTKPFPLSELTATVATLRSGAPT
ncbi:MAG: two-component system cell cycle sensor histidine kinase/response regulator CckA [Myxococcota bacterium]|jgi:two-component system cell cycle sensor histidine kinase/response regulator CckA